MKKLLVIIPALLLISICTVSQNKFSVNLYGGYTLPVSDLHGNFPDTLSTGFLDFTKSKTLLTTYGINFGVQGKFAVDSAGKQRITAGINYNTFSGSMDYSRPNSVLLSYKNKVTIITISAGVEYDINPYKKFMPFVGLEMAANFYGGKVEATGDTLLTINRKSESRFGVIANAGVDIKLWESSGIIAGVKYALTNLIGKSTELTTTASVPSLFDIEQQGSTSGSELPLNDKGVSATPDKILNYLQFYVGFSYNFGEKLGKRK